MNSNRCLIGVALVALVLMSGGMAIAQDSNATVVQDAYVLAYHPDTNYATQDLLRAGSPPADDWEQLIYVQFDLSPLPDDMHVENATLKLFNHTLEWANREYTDFGIKAVTSPWDENDVTFNTRPSLGDTTISNLQRQRPRRRPLRGVGRRRWRWRCRTGAIVARLAGHGSGGSTGLGHSPAPLV